MFFVTITSAYAFSNNAFLYKRPTLGIALWLGAFLSAGLATAAALVMSLLWAFDQWQIPHAVSHRSWLATLSITFLPWILLALAGISLAVISARLDEAAGTTTKNLPASYTPLLPTTSVDGIALNKIQLDVPIVFSSRSSRGPLIVISTGAEQVLSPDELRAVVHHEAAHYRFKHTLVLRLLSTIKILSFKVVATKVLDRELSLLLELQADRYASKETSPAHLRSALTKFYELAPDAELRLRILNLKHHFD